MSRITIEIKDEKTKKRLLEYIGKIEANIVDESGKNGPKVVKVMNEIAEKKGLMSIKDPVAWQREIRKDRKLPFRN